MVAPSEVIELIERFDANREAYRSGNYKEAQLRQEFINPFFKTLGWDVYNERGYAEAYKDVIHEDAIKEGRVTKAPDYCFRIGQTRKFFVEAKKPSVHIKDDTSAAYQLRRYAWSAKLPLSILTDFEDLAVYDCLRKPDHTDKASMGRVMLLTYKDYASRWDDIAAILSREAVLKGSFDKYAESNKGKRGTAEVDDAFLEEIEVWRASLAQNIYRRNPHLRTRELNAAVQATINRIVFLRISEARGIEPYGRLLELTNGQHVYERLGQLFRSADERYNSGLFHFRQEKGVSEPPDEWTLSLAMDDKPLKDVLKNLYYPESPYEFSVLPADILGQVYERFLGKVITLTPKHQAVVEDKPDVKKAGGVFYTPTYIVDYIVRNTVGKLLEGKTPKQVARLKIADIACGSGSFLIAAYQYLLDWYRDAYVREEPQKHKKELFQAAGGEWRLTPAERKRILLSHIYGVDIDVQAVEVTKLSLLLKVLEGESGETLATQLQFFRERALPNLGSNIKCGNSLIAPDFYENQQMTLLGEEERYRINVFDWHAEFPGVFRGLNPGFDAIIGNPPYIRMESFKELKGYLKANYASHDERSDLYAYFIEYGHRLLTGRGRFGMIVSNKFLRSNYGAPLRRFLSRNTVIERVVDFAGLPVFAGATVRTIILLTSRASASQDPTLYSPPLDIARFYAVAGGSLPLEQAIEESSYVISGGTLDNGAWSFASPDADSLLSRLQSSCRPLAEYCDAQICMGIKSGLTEAFVIDDQTRADIIRDNPRAREIIKPFLNGRDVRRYRIEPKNIHLIYTHHGIDIEDYPAVERHLRPFKARLQNRATRQEWYELQQPQYNFVPYLDAPKIIFPDIAVSPRFALDTTGYYGSNTCYFIPRHDLYLLGLLNSRLGFFYFVKRCAGLEGRSETYLRFFGQYLENFPVPAVNFSGAKDKAKNSKMVAMVKQMLALHEQMAAAKASHDKTALQRQIDALERAIDALVYELYGLTGEEVRTVEGATMQPAAASGGVGEAEAEPEDEIPAFTP